MIKNISIILAVITVIIIFAFLWSRDDAVTNYPNDGTSIVAFGDSLFEGVGSSEGNSLPEQISELIGEPIINLGVSGNTTADGLERVDEVLSRDPQLVLVSLGGNDIIRNVPTEEIYANLEQIIKRIQEQGAMVVLLGVRGPLKDLNDEYEELSREYGTGLVPDILDGLIGRPQYMYDTIHPNDAGYAVIAERVAPVVDNLIN